MTDRTAVGAILFVTLVVLVGMAVPAMGLSANTAEPSAGGSGETAAVVTPQNNSSVNVTVGPQLSTVVRVSSDEVQTGFENTAFEVSFENASEELQAEVIADWADSVRDRAESIREEYEESTEAYEDGELTRSEYAQRLAVLNARASNLLDSHDQLSQRAANVSTAELEAAGVVQSALNQSVENVSSVTGPGVGALLEQFTGESEGEVELDTDNGLSIEVENEDGERSRELERPRDDTDTFSVSQAAALETARNALSAPAGNWTLTDSEAGDGAYEFALVLRDAPGLTGEAEVAVDGSSGEVFGLEEEIEPRGDDDGETDETDEETDDTEPELAVVVADGVPGPNETVTVQVLANGEPTENVNVSINDRQVGTTDTGGRVVVTLPATDDVELTAQTDDAESELEFEFENAENGDDEADQDDTEDQEDTGENESS